MNKLIIGSEEWCALPEIKIPAIKVRIDSGAKTSSLHATNIKEFDNKGELYISFDVFPIEQKLHTIIHCKAKVIDRRMVKSSNGSQERRYVIETEIQMGSNSWKIELTLSNRDSMGYRMLLGRQAMENKILVDPGSSFQLGKKNLDDVQSLYPSKTLKRNHLRLFC